MTKARLKEWSLMERKPTIYEALRTKLGREPTHEEIKSEFRRILEDGTRERAEAGKLPHQRKKR